MSFEIRLPYWMEHRCHLIGVKLSYFLILAVFAIISMNSLLYYMEKTTHAHYTEVVTLVHMSSPSSCRGNT